MTLRTIDTTQVKAKFSELIRCVVTGNHCYIIRRRGKPVAAVISLEDLPRLGEFEDRLAARVLEKAVKTAKGFVSFEEMIRAYERATGQKIQLGKLKRRRGKRKRLV